MRNGVKAVLFGAALAALPVFMLAPARPSKKKKAPFARKNFAHRGLYKEDGTVPENSLGAFEAAASAGYGIELDVQLSKDGKVVVFHDDTLGRVCGVDSRVDEKTFDELESLKLLESDDRIPLFSEVLELINGRVPLIVELKNGKRNKELCNKTYALLKDYKGDVCVESFNPFIVAWFRFRDSDILRGQLATVMDDYDNMPKIQGFLLSNTLLNFISRPNFIAYKIGGKPACVRLAELLGAMKFAWTSHNAENEKGNDAVIFEFYLPNREI